MTSSSLKIAAYSLPASWLHLGLALPMIGSVGAVLQAQTLPKKTTERQWWMNQHESLGLLTAIILVPRMAYRLVAHKSMYAKLVEVPGSTQVEQKIAKATYFGLHGFGVVLSVTGVTMNYYSGWGLPFFKWKIPGVPHSDENKKKYGKFCYDLYKIHNQVGYYGKYLIPLHMAGTFKHAIQGHAIFGRINPLRSTIPKPPPPPPGA